jgi:protein TonB
MRGLAAIRLSVSLLFAVAVHGVVFGVAAVVLSREAAERPVPPPPLDVDLVEVAPPRPDPIADAAPGLVRAKLVAPLPVRRAPRELAPTRPVAVAEQPGVADPASEDREAPAPAAPAPAAVAAPSAARGPVGPTPSAGDVTEAEPRYRSNPPPDYPLASKRRREEGVVVLAVTIRADGSVAAVSIKRSSGHPLLDQAALDTVRRVWTFDPARAGGTPVSSTRDVPVRFTLSE